MGDTVFSVDWYKDFLSFQRNPKGFIDSKKLTREDFCMDILKDLYSDDVTTQCKCHLLLSLQEHMIYLIQDDNLLEQVVGSLQNLFISLDNDNKFLKCHIIIAIATLLLSWKTLDDNIKKLYMMLRNLLLDIIFNANKDYLLRSSACRCLEEMESFFPCLLKEQMETLLTAVKNDSLLPAQNYVVLLSLSLKHGIDQQNQETKQKSEEAKTATSRKYSSPLNRHAIHVHHYVSCIFDRLPSLDETSTYLVCRNLIHVVESTPDLLPAVFKPFLPKLITSSDILHFHLAFTLLETFGSDLFSSQEEKQLLHQLLVSLRHPMLSSSHRLLYLDWLKTLFTRKNIFSISMPKSCLEALLPGPFDGPYTQEKKIKLICTYLVTSPQSGPYSDFLMSCAMGLKRQSLLSPPLPTIASFFRCLYSIHLLLENTETQSDMQKMILDVMSLSPQLSPFVLDFLRCVKKDSDENVFVNTIFSMLVDHVVNLTARQCAQDFASYLPILESAVLEPPNICKPQAILRQLKKVVMEPHLLSGDNWIIGHNILSVCCMILKCHNIEILYHDLGELLNVVMKNIRNCDCQDRAKQYYAALTALPQARVKELFKNQAIEETGNISLTDIVIANDISFHAKNNKLTKPVFELIRLDRKSLSFPRQFESDAETNIAKAYTCFINSSSFQPCVKIPFFLRHMKDAPEEFSTIFAVVISTESSSQSLEIPDIEVPYLRKDDSEDDLGIPLEIEFVPRNPEPMTLHVRAHFTSHNGSSYRFQLPKITLDIENLFSIIPFGVESGNLKQQLFNELWKELEVDTDKRCLSAFCLKIPQEDLPAFVNANWGHFSMGPPKDGSHNIGIYLPPRSHLLMKLAVQNGKGFATVVTESKVLSAISCYMGRITQEKEDTG